MASDSIVRLRRSLVWDIKDVSKYQKESPEFYLMDSKWLLQLNPVYGTGKLSALSYTLVLKNCNIIDSFQPFEVVTFLQDRRSSVVMFCSKLTVSSAHAVLFKSKFEDTFFKLPGLKVYDDIAIVCSFYPSTGLALGTQTIKGSALRIRNSVIWKFSKPTVYQDRESPVFNVKNTKWKLEMHLTNGVESKSSVYHICLKNSTEIQSFQQFEVETFLVDRKNFEQFQCSRLIVSSTCETLYKATIDSIYQKLPGLKINYEIAVVCLFGPFVGSALNEKMVNDITMTLECQQCRSRDSFIETNPTKCSPSDQSHSSRFLPELENLSEEFSSLIDSNFMSDIQLKCGEEVIPAHKVILAARSTVFSQMLQGEDFESNRVIVEIKDIESVVMREFLKYVYSGKIAADLSEKMLCKLYAVSTKYDIQALRKLCSHYLISYLNAENFTEILILADAHSDQEFKDAVAGFIVKNSELLMSGIWLIFSEELPKLANEVYRTQIKMLQNRILK